VFSQNDIPILFVEPELGSRLAGRILDHDGAPGEERFTLNRPAADESPPAPPSRRT
jgi:hypothetical protein